MFGTIRFTQKMNTKGVGLGLVICRMISEQFGGFTQMFSLFDNGSIFQTCFKFN